jgi:K+-transporting ATPase KdpF subunit
LLGRISPQSATTLFPPCEAIALWRRENRRETGPRETVVVLARVLLKLQSELTLVFAWRVRPCWTFCSSSSRSGSLQSRSPTRRPARGSEMESAVVSVISLALVVYLFWSLLRPESF